MCCTSVFLFNLDCCMINSELRLLADSVDLTDGSLAEVGPDMGSHDVFTASKGPAMEIMHFFHCLQVQNSVIEVLDVDFIGGVLHDDGSAVNEDRYSCDQNQDGEEEGTDWICDLPFWLDLDDDCSCDNSRALDHISHDVNDSGSDVEVLLDLLFALLVVRFKVACNQVLIQGCVLLVVLLI